MADVMRSTARALENTTKQRDSTQEKEIERLAKHKLLSRKENPCEWLVNLNILSEQLGWTQDKYCRLLPRLWNTEASVSVTQFFNRLEEYCRRNKNELDRAFIEKFAQEGIEYVRHMVVTETQPEHMTSMEFIDRITFARSMLEQWNPDSVPTIKYVISTLFNRFTSIEMLKEMAAIRKQDLNWEQLEATALLADRREKIETKAIGTVRRVKREQVRTHARRPQGIGHESGRSHQALVRQIILEHYPEPAEEMEEEIEIMATEQVIYENSGRPTAALVAQIRKRAPPKPIRTWNKEEVKEYKLDGMVANGPIQHNGTQGHICPWFAIRGKCTFRNRGCKHEHTARTEQYCARGQECPDGAFCRNRHPKDKYRILFWDRNTGIYKEYVWVDRFSRFEEK